MVATTKAGSLAAALDQADLLDVLARLPDGLQTSLGDGGGLLSGGEGQRVRFGRALHRGDIRLAILDEPFRGLDREQRQRLLGQAREYWRGATLLCITHDLSETLSFDRVLVIDGGRIVEDGIASWRWPSRRHRGIAECWMPRRSSGGISGRAPTGVSSGWMAGC